MANTGPFYFKLVDPSDKTFDPTRHNGWDFEIFNFRRTLEEGQMPKLELVIKNPLRGLLDPAFNVWAWFSFYDRITHTWYPLFFGRLVGQPKELVGLKITIELIGWPLDYVKQKHVVARSQRIDPFWDPVAIAVKDRDNPDVMLEANTKLFHVDHLGGAVTLSDIINAEDGNVDFSADQVFYNFLEQSIDQPPLAAILCEMDTSWTQRWKGYVQIRDFSLQSYSGDGLINDWPKPGASIGGGYSVFDAVAVDKNRNNQVVTITTGFEYTNGEKTHRNGDALSSTWSYTAPVFQGPYLTNVILQISVTGDVDPYSVDVNGDPSPTNRPMSLQVNYMFVPMYNVTGTLTLKVQAQRQRIEKVVMTLNGDFQPVLVDPTVQQNAETMTISLADVGIPIIELLDYTDIAGEPVELFMIVFPDDPYVLGGTSTQVVTNIGSGTAALQQPSFSNIAGVVTTDANGVQYTSLGTTNPTDGNQPWASGMPVSGGQIILPREPLWVYWTVLTKSSFLQFPPVGAAVSLNQVIRGSNMSYWVCSIPGVTGLKEPRWSSTWGDTIIDGSVTWRCLGMKIPTGNDFFIALADGITGAPYLIPPFDTSELHARTTDGTVTWVYIGTGEIPVGGTIENTTGSWYFPTDRGQRSLRYGIAKMRAKMLNRSRCVTTKFQVSFMDGLNLTTRMSSTLSGENRIPGATCVGKNTLIELVGGGDGKFRTNITMKSCVGLDGTITPVAGDGVYAQPGVFQPGVQRMEGSLIVLPTVTDVGYTPPIAKVTDDGVTFPILSSDSIVLNDTVEGYTLSDQLKGINKAVQAAQLAATLPYKPITDPSQLVEIQKQIAILGADTVGLELSKVPRWRNLQLKPLDSGPYGAYYIPVLTRQQAPKQIDLQSGPA